MGKLKTFTDYVTKDQTPVKPEVVAPPVAPIKCDNCGHTGVPDPGHVCHMCHGGLSKVYIPVPPGTLMEQATKQFQKGAESFKAWTESRK